MTPAQAATITAAALLLLASSRASVGPIEAGEGDTLPTFSFDQLTSNAESIYNVITEQPAAVPMDTAQNNIAGFLAMLRQSEGTANETDPYAVCYGYAHTIQNFANHPAVKVEDRQPLPVTAEWRGERLEDAMCRNAGFGPGCVSTAAGAYQIIKPTWLKVQKKLGLPDFGPDSQDAAAINLIASRGALQDVQAGRIADAINKCRNEWASLPGNYARQGQRSQGDLIAWYQNAGGTTA